MLQRDNGAPPMKKKAPQVIPMDMMFRAYCRMDPVSKAVGGGGGGGADLLPLSQLNKWLASAKILDASRITTTDTGVMFFKFRKRAISYDEFIAFLNDLTSSKALDLDDTRKKMQTSGMPVVPGDINRINNDKT